jgi:hypothetical protein
LEGEKHPFSGWRVEHETSGLALHVFSARWGKEGGRIREKGVDVGNGN